MSVLRHNGIGAIRRLPPEVQSGVLSRLYRRSRLGEAVTINPDQPTATVPVIEEPKPTPSPPAEEPKEDPIAKLQNDPNALSQLLSQVQALTTKLGEVSTERDGYKQKEESTRRAQQTK